MGRFSFATKNTIATVKMENSTGKINKNETPIDTRVPKPYFSSGLPSEMFYVFYVSRLRKFMSTRSTAKINRFF